MLSATLKEKIKILKSSHPYKMSILQTIIHLILIDVTENSTGFYKKILDKVFEWIVRVIVIRTDIENRPSELVIEVYKKIEKIIDMETKPEKRAVRTYQTYILHHKY